jgi:NAD(P)H dehydrogenase (quinone)
MKPIDDAKGSVLSHGEQIHPSINTMTRVAIIFGCPTYMGSMSAGMKAFLETAARNWFTLAWKDKVGGALTNSTSFSGDKLNTLLGLVINTMQHGMIDVGLSMMPSANRLEELNSISGPDWGAHNRVGSFLGPMATSFQVKAPEAPSQGDRDTAEAYGRRVAEITAVFVRGHDRSREVMQSRIV